MLCTALVCLLALLPMPTLSQTAGEFTREELEQMLAPIALYPDPLLSQILMASTYPADVAEAAAWSASHPQEQGDAAVRAVETQNWDPSVKSLVAFPQVLQTMGRQPDWVQNLGDAFLASAKDVLSATQRLRVKAEQAGQLQSSRHQRVVAEPAPEEAGTAVIRIEPADPEVVYVPAYDPAVVYGDWPYPSYPPFYYPPMAAYYPGAALASGMVFGLGVAATAALWGNCDWGRGDVNINVNKYNQLNAQRRLDARQTSFQHNAEHRRGVPYRDERSRQQFSAPSVGDAGQRAAYRGRDREPSAAREQAGAAPRGSAMQRGEGREVVAGEAGTRERPDSAPAAGRGAREGGGARDAGREASSAPAASRRVEDHALRDAGDPARARQQHDRGVASRQSMSHSRSHARPAGDAGRAPRARGGRRP